MTDLAKTPVAATTNTNVDRSASKTTKADKESYWKQMLKNYEKRNASLERRRSALVERVRYMECTLPSLLVSAAASAAYTKRGILDEHQKIPENSNSTARKT